MKIRKWRRRSLSDLEFLAEIITNEANISGVSLAAVQDVIDGSGFDRLLARSWDAVGPTLRNKGIVLWVKGAGVT